MTCLRPRAKYALTGPGRSRLRSVSASTAADGAAGFPSALMADARVFFRAMGPPGDGGSLRGARVPAAPSGEPVRIWHAFAVRCCVPSSVAPTLPARASPEGCCWGVRSGAAVAGFGTGRCSLAAARFLFAAARARMRRRWALLSADPPLSDTAGAGPCGSALGFIMLGAIRSWWGTALTTRLRRRLGRLRECLVRAELHPVRRCRRRRLVRVWNGATAAGRLRVLHDPAGGHEAIDASPLVCAREFGGFRSLVL